MKDRTRDALIVFAGVTLLALFVWPWVAIVYELLNR